MRWARKDSGAVLLTTLLVMSIMSAIAVAMTNDIRVAILRSGNMKAHAQAEWHLKAAEVFAQSYIEQNFLPLSKIEKNIALRNPIDATLPIDGGVLQLTIMDGSQCIPLSSLVQPVETDDFGNPVESEDTPTGFREAFVNLLVDIGLPELEAAGLTAAIVDWQDRDEQISNGGAEDFTYLALDPAYRTPNAPFHSVQELRAVRGITEDILELLLPFVCAGDPERMSAVNINTLRPEHLPLLSAILGPDEDSLAADLIQRRPPNGYDNIAEELANLGVDTARVRPTDFLTEPGHLWIEVDAVFGDATRTVLLEFKIDSDGLERTYRHYGTEGRRPRLDEENNR